MVNKRWTADDVPDLQGTSVLVTGGNSGIGLEAARLMAGRGASVALGCRSIDKGERAAADIRRTHPAAAVEVLELDLADLESVAAAAEEAQRRWQHLDLLINNAGVMALPYRQTVDGFEMQFGTNHLGHFALTGRLLPLLLAASTPRVVTVSSFMHRAGRLNLANLDAANGYDKWAVYCMSKLANLLFTFELQRRAERARSALTATAAHPGYTRTNLQSAGPRMRGANLAAQGWKAVNLVGQTPQMGALPTVYAAVGEEVRGGDYIGPRGPVELRGYPTKVKSTRAARDPVLAGKLWDVSESMTGVSYPGLASVAT